MGIPIKDRGIRWQEAYGDKSAYLKEEYEKQVGPGSYFRWEGHDHTTGVDYYAVVTPGFSEKHGYHFFAALRKMPAENGASGKKFKTQAEALSYAFETWRVPPPASKPHKPYIDKDLTGKPIVLENVHAGLEPRMTKDAMAFMSSGPAGHVVNNYGPKEYAADLRNAAAMNMIMGPGAALYTSKQWQVVDKYDQGPTNIFVDENTSTNKIHTGLATCEAPSEALWAAAMNPAGIPTEKRLLKIDRKAGEVQITPPRMPNAANSSSYQLIRFDNIMNITPTLRVGNEKKQAFDQLVQRLSTDQSFTSKLLPQQRISIVKETAPSKKGNVQRGNYSITVSIPVDLFKNFQGMLDQAKMASVEKLRWEDDNAIELYSHFLKTGQLDTPTQIEQAKQTPVIEVSRPAQGQLVIYDQRGWPLGLKIKQSRRYDQEAADDDESLSDVVLPFKKGQVESMLPQANNDLNTLRSMLANNKIQLQREMFVDGRTCAPKNRHIWAMMPDLDEHAIPKQGPDGQLLLKRRSLIDRYQLDATGGKVRVFNPSTNREELRDIPPGVPASQNVDGAPLIMKGAKYYVPIPGESGETWHEIDAGETRIYDPDSAGKFKNGAVFTVYAKPEKSSAKKSNIKDIHGKGQDSLGFFAGHKKTLSDLLYRAAPNIQDRHKASLYSIILPNGQEMVFPENPDATPNDPTVQYVKSNQPIAGYFYVGQRQYAQIPFSSSQAPKIDRRKKDESGTVGPEIDPATGQPMTPLEVGEDDVSTVYKGVTYFNKMATAIDVIKATLGWDDKIVGRWTNATIDDLHAADDKVREVDRKLAAGTPVDQLSREEQIFAEFEKKGNEIPLAALQEFAQVTGDPKQFESRKGTLYQIMQKDANGISPASDHLFVTQDKANAFMRWMTETGTVAGQLFLSPIADGDLMVSAHKAKSSGQEHAVTHNVEFVTPPALPSVFPEEPQPLPVDPTPSTPMIPSMEPQIAEQPAQPHSMFDFEPAPQPVAAGEPEGMFDFPSVQPTVAPKQNAKRPDPPNPLFDFNQASAIQRLTKLADLFDKAGKIQEADAIDRVIKTSLSKKIGG